MRLIVTKPPPFPFITIDEAYIEDTPIFFVSLGGNGLDKWHIYGYNVATWHIGGGIAMIVRTRIFELRNGRYHNLSELAMAMGISISQIYRVREGKRSINQKFIVGAIKAFPSYRLEELFYLIPEPEEQVVEEKERVGVLS